MTSDAQPTADRDRLVGLDVLRGVAVLGIFAMNVQSFAMPEAAYIYPRAYGDLTGANYAVWLLSHVFASGKFIAIFSLLFGVGIALRDRADENAAARFWRRQLCLLAIGLAHAFLLWHGDVLVSYAIVGCLVYPFRRANPKALVAIGAAAYVGGTLLMAAISSLTLLGTPASVAEVRAAVADPAGIAADVAAFAGSYAGQLPHRAQLFIEYQLYGLPLYTLPLTAGLMFAGVGLARLGFFAGAWRRQTYATIAVVGAIVGLSLIALELRLDARFGHDPLLSAYVFSHLNTVGAVPLAMAYASIVMLAASRAKWPALAAVGRTALSCYLLQTLIGTTLFYGHGLGLYGRVERLGQLGITLIVWIAMLVLAPLWLRGFRFGPVEWVWRCATYGRWQPMRRSAANAVSD